MKTKKKFEEFSEAQKKQVQEAQKKGAAARANQTHCVNDHPYTRRNTYFSPSTGKRECKICRAERQRQSRKRAKEQTAMLYENTFSSSHIE
jgi:hypothetical protein